MSVAATSFRWDSPSGASLTNTVSGPAWPGACSRPRRSRPVVPECWSRTVTPVTSTSGDVVRRASVSQAAVTASGRSGISMSVAMSCPQGSTINGSIRYFDFGVNFDSVVVSRRGRQTARTGETMTETTPIFDFDNHYYEAEDAFTRHQDKRLAQPRGPLGRDRRPAAAARRRQGQLPTSPTPRSIRWPSPGASTSGTGATRSRSPSSTPSASSSRSGPSTGTAPPASR